MIGYGESVETTPGVYEDTIVEKLYFGDVIRDTRRRLDGEKVNDDITTGNSISVVGDAYASEHIFDMKYVKWKGVLWEIAEVEVESPRLLLRLGNVYNGPKI